jgi:hypothetical protein
MQSFFCVINFFFKTFAKQLDASFKSFSQKENEKNQVDHQLQIRSGSLLRPRRQFVFYSREGSFCYTPVPLLYPTLISVRIN